MKKRAVFVALLLCSCATHQKFVRSVDAYNQLILPDYYQYVLKDSTLSEKGRKSRIETAKNFWKYVEKAKRN